jgi:hypothetical protein
MRQLIEGTEMLKGEFRQLDQKLENWRARLLNALRQILNLKVTEIAVQLGDVSWKELEDMETGKARLSLTVAKRLMELYHCDPQLI